MLHGYNSLNLASDEIVRYGICEGKDKGPIVALTLDKLDLFNAFGGADFFGYTEYFPLVQCSNKHGYYYSY